MDRKWVKWVAIIVVVAFFVTIFAGLSYTIITGGK